MEKNSKRFKFKEVNISEIDGLEKNAHYMEQGMFNRLVDNIKKDGALSSVPFCVPKDDGRYEVVSGNHRVKAAKVAGIPIITIMYADDLTKDQKLAIQLSHNSINGKDDLTILRELLEEISTGEYKDYAHISEDAFLELEKMDYEIVQPKHTVIPVTFFFYDYDNAKLEELIKLLEEKRPEEVENSVVLPMAEFDRIKEVVAEVQKKFKIKSYGLSMSKIITIAREALKGKE